MKQADILRNAAEFILNSFNKHQDTRLVFHNYAYTQSLVRCVKELGNETPAATEEEIEAAQLAAWFLYSGYLFDYQNYTKYSLDQVQRFLILQAYPESSQTKVLRCLQTVAEKRDCHALSEKILADAVIINFIDNFEEKSPLLRLEHEFILHRAFSKQEWAQQQLQTLLGLNLQTLYAKSKYEPQLAQAIRIQKLILEKAARNAEPTPKPAGGGLYQNLDESPIRAVQTFFRANYRNHINLSAIADNKANIMISVNSILISVLISVLSYRNMAETHPDIVLPVVIFLVSGLASLIFAVLSARPKVTALNNEKMPQEQIRRNIVFFGNFVSLQLEEYEEAMDAMFRDSELMYGNMTRDLYYLGKVLEKKYRYLTVSYNIFMVGFIATVSMFLFTFFT